MARALHPLLKKSEAIVAVPVPFRAPRDTTLERRWAKGAREKPKEGKQFTRRCRGLQRFVTTGGKYVPLPPAGSMRKLYDLGPPGGVANLGGERSKPGGEAGYAERALGGGSEFVLSGPQPLPCASPGPEAQDKP